VTVVARRAPARADNARLDRSETFMPNALRLTLLMGAALAVATSALADPPKHAPAHGWRKKHDADYVGYTGEHWERDYDVLSGRCNRQAIGAVVGGVVGGSIANRVADPENRAVATLIGAAIGALVGGKVGHELDEADRGCFGHALEIGEAGRRVVWINEATHVRYELSPGEGRDRNGASCRTFTITAVDGRDKSSRSGLACRTQPGAWQIVQ
jgi:surface antigen